MNIANLILLVFVTVGALISAVVSSSIQVTDEVSIDFGVGQTT